MKVAILTVFFLIISSSAWSEIESEEVTIGGHFLGLWNYVWQLHEDTFFNDRRQFDYAINLDVNWIVNERISGVVQFQTSPGGGSFEFPGPEPKVVDLNVVMSFPEIKSEVTLGSFDAPFGITTDYLTNNADATRNLFFLNPLFFSAFAGSPSGILNVIGVKETFETEKMEFTIAGYNNLIETSGNADGGFGVCTRIALNLNDRFHSAGSFIYSPERYRYKFYGCLADARLQTETGFIVSGYFGTLRYDDFTDSTEDNALIWMGEAGYNFKQFTFAVRASGWLPDDRDGGYQGMSFYMPYIGFGVRSNLLFPAKDQEIIRYQTAVGMSIIDGLMAKVEYFFEDYAKHNLKNESTDEQGIIMLLQGSF